MRRGFWQSASFAFDQSEKGFDLAVVGRESAGFFDFFIGRVELLLPHCEQSEISPTGRLARSDLGGAGQLLFRANVFAGLQSGQADVKRHDQFAVFFRIGFGQSGVALAGGECEKNREYGTNGNNGTNGKRPRTGQKISVCSAISVCSVFSIQPLNHSVGYQSSLFPRPTPSASATRLM